MSRRDRDTDRERERPSGRDRNDRNSGSRRRRSGFDKEPSPKRSRRDDKPQTEKVVSKSHPDATDLINRSQRDNLKLQDAVPLGAAPSHDSKMESAEGKKEPEKNPNEHQSEDIPSSNPTEVPRSRSYFQAFLCLCFNSMMNVVMLGKLAEATFGGLQLNVDGEIQRMAEMKGT
ncbi:hypothetical protein LINPERHAP2_LOCUS12483 [Linum perenne]